MTADEDRIYHQKMSYQEIKQAANELNKLAGEINRYAMLGWEAEALSQEAFSLRLTIARLVRTMREDYIHNQND